MALAVVFAVPAQAAEGVKAAGSPQAESYQAAVREAGVALNTRLTECRQEAARKPTPSRRELKSCERTARAAFRQDVRHARRLLKQRPA